MSELHTGEQNKPQKSQDQTVDIAWDAHNWPFSEISVLIKAYIHQHVTFYIPNPRKAAGNFQFKWEWHFQLKLIPAHATSTDWGSSA